MKEIDQTKEGKMLKLNRAYLDDCTIGKIFYKGEWQTYTVEPPYKSNQENISCIPPGLYNLETYSSKKHPNVFRLVNHALNVGDENYLRDNVLIHILNFPCETLACIGPGLKLHPKKWGVRDSKKAMNKLRDLIYKNDIKQIEIT